MLSSCVFDSRWMLSSNACTRMCASATKRRFRRLMSHHRGRTRFWGTQTHSGHSRLRNQQRSICCSDLELLKQTNIGSTRQRRAKAVAADIVILIVSCPMRLLEIGKTMAALTVAKSLRSGGP